MSRPPLVYSLYERHLAASLNQGKVPHHVGVMLDGNRRWARQFGHDVSEGYRRGAAKIGDLLTWCEDIGVKVVTLYLLSTDNLSRDPDELGPLIQIIEGAVKQIASGERWRVHAIGDMSLLPDQSRNTLAAAEAATAGHESLLVNLAIGYGGRHEITDAVRSLMRAHQEQGGSLEDLADSLTPDHIGEHLYTKGQPDPDLVIRTSGEQRLSGFLLWQSANTELYFCEAFWPDFRRVDFLRALRSYSQRERRFGI